MTPSNQRRRAFEYFLQCFRVATANIPPGYILLPIAGSDIPIYRERVYSYELYHQLKLALSTDYSYSLGGEVDKIGHPLIRGRWLKRAKPDLLVHRPGDMAGNLVAIEIKPITARAKGIEKDLRTLTAFRQEAGYYQSIYLVYGSSERAFETFRRRAHNLQARDTEHQIDLNVIALYWHCRPGFSAEQVEWGAG